jgi:hypothetical protein
MYRRGAAYAPDEPPSLGFRPSFGVLIAREHLRFQINRRSAVQARGPDGRGAVSASCYNKIPLREGGEGSCLPRSPSQSIPQEEPARARPRKGRPDAA